MKLFNSIVLALIVTVLLIDSAESMPTNSELKANKLQRQLMRGFKFYQPEDSQKDTEEEEEKEAEQINEELIKSDAAFLARSPLFLQNNYTKNFPRRMRLKDPTSAKRSNPFRPLNNKALRMFVRR